MFPPFLNCDTGIFFTTNLPRMGLTVDSSQLTFLSTSKSRDTKTRPNIKKSGPIKFRYCL